MDCYSDLHIIIINKNYNNNKKKRIIDKMNIEYKYDDTSKMRIKNKNNGNFCKKKTEMCPV